ncbi:PfkB family carbohydrate kinase [Mycobacterium paraterrae]|uniref:Ribokinase n=1 Tax=Mycobacterium paraterrae TaxID=577492 RepID=A0ABY3VLE0_9MYCO|nr:PfkB family carbohydrate kinase [Mycobacterium paraterrae]UMB68313.1 PfkB family carbohydrate kinase [Mycobacterium paraterrae]
MHETTCRPTVYVVGAINIDIVIKTSRFPSPGETVVGDRAEHHGGGKGANAAVAAARAGANVVLIGAVGVDANGELALADLNSCNVDTRRVRRCDGASTGLAMIVVDDAGENQITVGVGANAEVAGDTVAQILQGELRPNDCVLVSTEIPGDAVLAAVEHAESVGATCVLNPAPPVDEVLDAFAYKPILTPNAGECRQLAMRIGLSARDIRTAATELCEYTGAPVVVTMGGEGVLLCEPGKSPVHIEPLDVSVVDTTGAGDSFNGVFAARLADGDAIDAAASAANRAAAKSVEVFGARGLLRTS